MGGSNSKALEKEMCLQMHNAILNGDEELVQQLIESESVNINSKLFVTSHRLSLPLFTAVENNQVKIIEMLLQYQVSPAVVNKEGNTPLHLAVIQNLYEVAKMLIDKGSDPNATNAFGDTPLHIASKYGLNNMALLFIRCDVSVNTRGRYQRTPLLASCAIPGNLNMTKLLLENNSDVDLQDEEGRTALHYLAQLGNTQGIELLLNAGASKNTADHKGKTSLHITVENEEVCATRALLRHKCDINWQDDNGFTAVHRATEKGFADLVEILIQNEADVNIPSNKGRCPLRNAVWKKNYDIVQKLLIDGGANVNAVDHTGITALHVACLYAEKNNEDDLGLVELLIQNGADVNMKCKKFGRSPLHNAVEAGNDEVVLLLLRNSADTQLVDNKGKTALSLSTVQNISSLLTDGRNGGTETMGMQLQQSTTVRPMNFYIRPNSQNSSGGTPQSQTLPPPVPPRDVATTSAPASDLVGRLSSPQPMFDSNATPVTRHVFMWTSRNNDSALQDGDSNENSLRTVQVSASKLLSFSTNHEKEQVVCYSISTAKQTINTNLGCILDVESSSALNHFLLYAEAMNYSNNILPLSSQSHICSNILHFYTYHMPRERGDAPPEKDVPHFSKPVELKFSLKRSAVEKSELPGNEIKLMASYDEGTSWEELDSRVEEFYAKEDDFVGGCKNKVKMIVAATNELGMFAVVVGPTKSTKHIQFNDNKIVSSVDNNVHVSLLIGHEQSCFLEMSAIQSNSDVITKLRENGFPYLVGCSRLLCLQFQSEITQVQAATFNLPVILHSHHADVTYRVLMNESSKTDTPNWNWEDVTETRCQQFQVSQVKSKKSNGIVAGESIQNCEFCVNIDLVKKLSFLVICVRAFTSTLSRHLVSLPRDVENHRNSAKICFLISQKGNQPSHVICKIILVGTEKQFTGGRQNQKMTPPIEVHERNIVVITTDGNLKINKKENYHKIVFHSGLLPITHEFVIKGVKSTSKSNSHYAGNINFCIENSNSNNGPTCSRLNSESSVLVMENSLLNSSQSDDTQPESNKIHLASLPFKLPKKSRLKKSGLSSGHYQSLLSNEILRLICKTLDKPEIKELGFQLGIEDVIVNATLTCPPEKMEDTTVKLLSKWRSDVNAMKQDDVSAMCLALKCIGRDNLSQDVVRKCSPFIATGEEEIPHAADLPSTSQNILENVK